VFYPKIKYRYEFFRVLKDKITSYSDIFGSDIVISFIKCMREVKVTAIFYHRIKHGSFPSLCIRENHRSVLESIILRNRWYQKDNTF